MAGHRLVGYLQIIFGLAGFAITLVALIKIALVWVHDFQLPADPAYYRSAIAGLAVFLVSWGWSLVTSLSLLRESDKPAA
jgi:hypothetical protein